MIGCDALVVGGGPGGSTCAWVLRRAGWNVIIVDRARFPRNKVCAGWLTPEVFSLLQLDPAEYRAAGHTLQPITGFRTGLLGAPPVETRYNRTVSYAIRRCEFDHFLLRRAQVRVIDDTPVTSIRPTTGGWVVNDTIEARVMIGAGGHFCPVARHMRGRPDAAQPIVAKEVEFRLQGREPRLAPDTPQLLFSRDLQGYAWCVRKDDYVNVGIGRRDHREFNRHLGEFIDVLGRAFDITPPPETRWHGHAYLASGSGPRPFTADGVLLVGDAAGLAYPESGEGIRPAIESGRLAASTLIAADGRYTSADLAPYATALLRMHPAVSPAAVGVAASAAIGRLLLRSAFFTRRVVLDRWFLRSGNGGHGSAVAADRPAGG